MHFDCHKHDITEFRAYFWWFVEVPCIMFKHTLVLERSNLKPPCHVLWPLQQSIRAHNEHTSQSLLFKIKQRGSESTIVCKTDDNICVVCIWMLA